MPQKNIALLAGGFSGEYEVSVNSAKNIAANLFVVGDESKIRRIIMNLVSNGVEALMDNQVNNPQIEIAAKADNAHNEVIITIRDNGPGIPQARREEAFRPFHRLDQGRNLQSGGSGLGLAIARDIARAHGGDILLGDSALGGLKAVIRLPV